MKFHTYAFKAQANRNIKPSTLKKETKNGYYLTVPDFKPKTEIFIKKGEDPKKVIKRFKEKRVR